MQIENAAIPGACRRQVANANDDHIQRIENAGVRFRASARCTSARAKSAATAAFMAKVAARTATALAITKSTAATIAEATTLTIAEAATTATFAEASAARRRCGCRSVELKLCGHRLAAVLRKLERETLTFGQRLNARFRQCGDVYEDICPATVRKNETKALSLIEPLYSSRFPHCQSLSPCKSIWMPGHPQDVRARGYAKDGNSFRVNQQQ